MSNTKQKTAAVRIGSILCAQLEVLHMTDREAALKMLSDLVVLDHEELIGAMRQLGAVALANDFAASLAPKPKAVKPPIGVPYAYNCKGCYKAVICPCCGEHIKQGPKGLAYAKHFEANHEHGDPMPFIDKRIGCGEMFSVVVEKTTTSTPERFTVKIRKIGTMTAATIDELRAAMESARDAGGYGASDIGGQWSVRNKARQIVALLSYNGRVQLAAGVSL